MNKKRALMLGVTSGVVIVGGIIMAVLLSQLVATTAEGNRDISDESWRAVSSLSGAVAVFGLVYIVPGVIGLIAAFLQNKCLYVTTCIFTMISLVIMALVVLIAGLSLIALVISTGKISESCIDDVIDGRCKCRTSSQSYNYQDTPFRTCAYFEKMISIMIALALFIILAWVAAVAEFVIACYFSCRSQASSGTVLMTTQQQPMLQTETRMGPPPGYSQGDYPAHAYGQGQPLPMKV
ncbi:hypothetical protein BsWGS_28089 [Bradybaena similaris]